MDTPTFRSAILLLLTLIGLSLAYLAWEEGQERARERRARAEAQDLLEKARSDAEARCRFAVLDAKGWYQANRDSEVLDAETVRNVALARLRGGCGLEARLEDYPEITE